MDERLLGVALGREKADLVVLGERLVNVNTGEIYPGGVAVAGERIAAIGDVGYTVGEGTEIVEAGDGYIVPGFVEGHSPREQLLERDALRGGGLGARHDQRVHLPSRDRGRRRDGGHKRGPR